MEAFKKYRDSLNKHNWATIVQWKE